MRNSHEASMISRPLFIMVAESTVIFAPMFQFWVAQRLLWCDGSKLIARFAKKRGRRTP